MSHRPCVLGAFKYRRHSAHEANHLWLEMGHVRGIIETVMRDGKAADQDLCAAFQRQCGIVLLTTPRTASR
jgi:hypothetical protein